MTIPALFKEYIWLVNTIKRAQRITFAEIQDLWLETDMSEGAALARSTFNRHKDAILDMFGICIECDRKDGYRYYIDNEYALHDDTVQNWMFSTMSVNNIISESKALHERILFQQIPCDEHLQIFINAMKQKVRVLVKYRRYGSENVSVADFEPYCLKLFNQRWYVLAHFHRNATSEKEERDYFAIYAFDRIQSVELTDVKFEVKDDFEPQNYFHDFFGVVTMDSVNRERIVIRAFDKQQFYMKDLPLHHSQKEIAHGENYTDFEYHLRPTPDFCGHLLSLSNHVQVIEPESLSEKIQQMALDTLQRYGITVSENIK